MVKLEERVLQIDWLTLVMNFLALAVHKVVDFRLLAHILMRGDQGVILVKNRIEDEVFWVV